MSSRPSNPTARTKAAEKKRRNRNGIIIAVLIVLLAGVVAAAAAKALTSHNQVLVVDKNVPVGATITDDDLTSANITADPNLKTIPVGQRNQIIGLTAQVQLFPGQLLTRAQVGAATGLSANQVIVPLPLKPTQLPARSLNPGQQVLIVATPSNNGTGAATPSTTGTTAVVAEVGTTNAATQVTVVDVTVANTDATALAQQAATGNIALILLPAK